MMEWVAGHPVRRVDGDVKSGILLLCDHASNWIDPEFGALGLPPEQLERHIAYDIGAKAVTDLLAKQLGAPALYGMFSRLLIDPNRGADDPTLIMRISDGAMIPGNRHIGAVEREDRLNRFWRPYHRAIEAEIARFSAAGIVPMILSIHSFTPLWRGVKRPWDIGILWDRDPRLAQALIEGYRAQGDLIVGDNEPYDGALKNDTLYWHATRRGLAHVLIEYRQDLIAQPQGQAEWASRTLDVLEPLRGREEFSRLEHFGSRAGAVLPLAF